MRVLICGVSGMIGHKLWQVLSSRHDDVLGTLHGQRATFAGYQLFDDRVSEDFAAENFDLVSKFLDELQPNVIVNCIGITKRKEQASELEMMFQVNTRFPHCLALWAARRGARVIHFSTDCVFDGAEGNYEEQSVVTAPDLYGQTKYFGELDYKHCLTIRTSMIGRELAGFTELLEWFLSQAGKRVMGYKNALYSGLTTPFMASIVERLIWEYPELSGKYQIAGPAISKYELLRKLRDVFKLKIEIDSNDTFHCDRTLRSDRFTHATGIKVSSWDEMIGELAGDRELYERASVVV